MDLNNILHKNNNGRKRVNQKENIHLPLKGHLICSECHTKMTGYRVKKKGLWYYKCNTIGCGSNQSAKTLNNLWVDHLPDLQMDKLYLKPIKKGLELAYIKLLKESTADTKSMKAKATVLKEKHGTLE